MQQYLRLTSMQRDTRLVNGEHKSGFSNQTIQRVGMILRCFVENNTELGVTFIGQYIGVHKSTASRLLTALGKEGFVEQNPKTGKWRLGLGLLSLASVVLERMDIREVAQVHLRALAELTQETINLTVLNDNEGVNVERISSLKAIRHVGKLGRRTPLHCTSTGRVLLAFLAPEERKKLLPEKLQSYTKSSLVDRRILEQMLDSVREQGYAIVHEEYEEGLSAIAAPIRDHTSRVVATVSISGPTYRIGPGRIETFVDPLVEAANKISASLGYMVPRGTFPV